MNAPAEIFTPEIAHRRATEEANQWRGRLINLYARAEGAITRALGAAVPDKPAPLLFSQRISRLRKALEADGKLLGELEKLEAKLDERNSLVHGEGKVWTDLNGGWLLQLRHRGRTGEVQFTLCQDSAKSSHDQLHKLVQRLSNKLGS